MNANKQRTFSTFTHEEWKNESEDVQAKVKREEAFPKNDYYTNSMVNRISI